MAAGYPRRAWRIQRAGSLDRLTCVSDILPGPGPGQVRVEVHAVGLNFADVFAVLGLYSATPAGPFVPGLEFAGAVEAVGEGVTTLRAGQEVIGLTRFGAYATAVTVDARYLRPLPAGWTHAEGAAWLAQALTAWYAICELGALPPNATVLVHSAAGGVGLNALEILKARGAGIVATVGQPAKVPLLTTEYGLAPSAVIVRDSRRFGEQLDASLLALGRHGFDLVLDGIAGPYFDPAYRRLNAAGRMVIFGAADMMPAGARPNWPKLAWRYLRRPRVDPFEMISANRSVMGFNLIWLWDQIDRLAPALNALGDLIPRPPRVGRVFAFAEAPAALRYLQSGQSVGKVVLSLSSSPGQPR